MTDAQLEQALRRSGARLASRPVSPALRHRLLAVASGGWPAVRAARRMVLTLALANAVIAAIALAGGIGHLARGTATSAPPPASAAMQAVAAAASTPSAPPLTPLDKALIDGRRIVVDAMLQELSDCHEATATVLPPDPAACRGSAVMMAQAATGFIARLQALPLDATRPEVNDLVHTLVDLRRHAEMLAADIDRGDTAAVLDDAGWVGGLACVADMALVFAPPL